jgi:hypothetical protein
MSEFCWRYKMFVILTIYGIWVGVWKLVERYLSVCTFLWWNTGLSESNIVPLVTKILKSILWPEYFIVIQPKSADTGWLVLYKTALSTKLPFFSPSLSERANNCPEVLKYLIEINYYMCSTQQDTIFNNFQPSQQLHLGLTLCKFYK